MDITCRIYINKWPLNQSSILGGPSSMTGEDSTQGTSTQGTKAKKNMTMAQILANARPRSTPKSSKKKRQRDQSTSESDTDNDAEDHELEDGAVVGPPPKRCKSDKNVFSHHIDFLTIDPKTINFEKFIWKNSKPYIPLYWHHQKENNDYKMIADNCPRSTKVVMLHYDSYFDRKQFEKQRTYSDEERMDYYLNDDYNPYECSTGEIEKQIIADPERFKLVDMTEHDANSFTKSLLKIYDIKKNNQPGDTTTRRVDEESGETVDCFINHYKYYELVRNVKEDHVKYHHARYIANTNPPNPPENPCTGIF